MRMRPTRRMVAAVALALASLTVAFPARADGPGATLQVRAGWDGQAHAGALVPIWVDVNAGPALVTGKLELHFTQSQNFGQGGKSSGTYSLPVEVPAGGHVRRLMLVNNDGGGSLGPLELKVGDRAVATESIKLESQSLTRLVGVLGDDATIAALGVPDPTNPAQPVYGGGKFGGPLIAETQRPVRLVHLDPALLPDSGAALDSLDIVVLDRFAAGNLAPEQVKLLQTYVASGGKLVLAGGPEGAKVIAPFAQWLGVEVGAVTSVPFSTFGATPPTGLGAGERQVPVLALQGSALRTLATAGGQPVAYGKSVGTGTVAVLAYDPALAPLAGWSGRHPYWDDLLRGLFPAASTPMGNPMGGPPPGPGGMDMSLASTVQFVSPGNLPSQTRWLWVLGGYALLIGPVNLLLWRLLKRPGGAWPTLLVGALGATLVLIPLARRLDPPVVLNPASLVYASSGSSTARVAEVVGLLATPEAQAEVGVPAADYLTLVGSPTMGPFNGQPPATELGDINLGKKAVVVKTDLKGGLQVLYATGTVDLGGSLDLDLHLAADQAVGLLVNHTDKTWHDLTLVAGQTFTRLGELKPGETAKVSMLLPPATPGGCCGVISVQQGLNQAFQPVFKGGPGPAITAWPMQQRMTLVQAMGNHFWMQSGGQYQVVLVGWTDQIPLGLTVAGQPRKTVGMTMLGQEVHIGTGPEAFKLPAGYLPAVQTAWVVEDTQFNGMFGPDMGVPMVGSATYSYQLPADVQRSRVKQITYALPMPGGNMIKGPTVELWNWQTGAWQHVAVGTGPGEQTVDKAQTFISPSGEIRLRVSRHDKPDPQKGGMYPIGRPQVGIAGEGEGAGA